MAAAAVAVILLAVVAYALLRNDPFATPPSQGTAAAPGAEPELKLKRPAGTEGAPGGTAPVVATPPVTTPVTEPVPPPPVTTPTVAEPAGTGPAGTQPGPASAEPPPKGDVVPVVARPDRPPPPRPHKGSGARQVVEGMNVLKVPGAASGEGILTITASPWANAFLDGHELGETPREARVGEGSYRVKLTHPTLGTRETTVTVPAGRRTVYNANLSK